MLALNVLESRFQHLKPLTAKIKPKGFACNRVIIPEPISELLIEINCFILSTGTDTLENRNACTGTLLVDCSKKD